MLKRHERPVLRASDAADSEWRICVLVHLEDGVPTDTYGLDEAVDAGYLLPPKGVSVGTNFLRQGIKYDD